jgi:hypothetical protein
MVEGNDTIIRDLYRRYYAEGRTDGHAVSSHWRDFIQNLEVTPGRDGIPVSLGGFGFGDLQSNAVLLETFTLMAAAAGILTGPNRRTSLRLIPTARKLVRKMELRFSQDALRQVRTLAFLRQHLGNAMPKRVLIIGDGYGLLSSLLKTVYPRADLTLIDIGQVLLFQAVHCQRAFPDSQHFLFTPTASSTESSLRHADFTYCTASEYGGLNGPFDLAINIASMQEMAPSVVAEYFRLMRRWKVSLFYCCNREHKKLVGGEISDFHSYPWRPTDIHLVDELCPWHQWFVGRSVQTDGPRVWRFRVPFSNYFDGPIRHRLTRLEHENPD